MDAKADEKAWKLEFDNEANVSENLKIKGQPIRAKIEDIMRELGIDRGEYYGRKLEGPESWKMMAMREEFCDKLSEYIVSTNSKSKYNTKKELLWQLSFIVSCWDI